MVLTIQAQVLLSLARLYYLVTQLFHISILNREAFVYVVNCEVIWLPLGKLHHWFVSYLPKAIKVALLHMDVIVSANVNVVREMTRQKLRAVRWTFRWFRIMHACVCVCECVCLNVKVAEQTENMKSTFYCLELLITNSILLFTYLEKNPIEVCGSWILEGDITLYIFKFESGNSLFNI